MAAELIVKNRTQQSGQVAVEYILLLIVGVGVWMLIVNQLVSRNADPSQTGIVIKKWVQIIQFIGSDQIDN